MITVVGTFKGLEAAARAVRDLRLVGAGNGSVRFLRPDHGQSQLFEIPAAGSEAPGMAQTMGAFLAGAVGTAAGLALGATAAGFFLPGVVPALVCGGLGAAVLGLAGVAAGSAAGRKAGLAVFEGLPEDEFFVYRDALRKGRAVVVCLSEKPAAAEEARRIMEHEGAESIDAARHNWWLGVGDSARLLYTARAPRAQVPEDPFRRGYQAALNPEFRGKPWDQVVYLLAERYGNWYDDAFRRGFEGGQRRAHALSHAH